MSSGSPSIGDGVVPKFDMHIYTFVLTVDEVKSLVEEYLISLDLHPCVSPSVLTMNNLQDDKIGIYDKYLELPYMPCREGIKILVYPSPTGVRAEDVCRLRENMIDLRPVHLTMLYEIGLTTIWKHVGHRPVFEDGEETGDIIALRSRCPEVSGLVKGPLLRRMKLLLSTLPHLCLSDPKSLKNMIIRRLSSTKMKGSFAAKRKAQAAKDKAAGKRSAAEVTSRRTKKKKTTPLSFALSESEGGDSNHRGSDTHHSASPLNTIIQGNVDPTAGGGGLTLESVSYAEDDMDHNLDKVDDGTEVNSPLPERSPEPQHTTHSDEGTHAHSGRYFLHHDEEDAQAHRHASGFVVSSSSGGSSRQVFPQRNPGGDGAGGSSRGDMAPPAPFVPAWRLTTHPILNDTESCRDMMINLATLAVQDQQSRLSDYQAPQCSWLTKTQNQLVDVIHKWNKLADDHKNLQQEHLGCAGKEASLVEKLAAVKKKKDDLLDKSREQAKSIKQLEEDLASKISSLAESEGTASSLKGDLERLTVDLSHAEIVRHNYVRQLLPTAFQRFLSSDENKKSLSDVFNIFQKRIDISGISSKLESSNWSQSSILFSSSLTSLKNGSISGYIVMIPTPKSLIALVIRRNDLSKITPGKDGASLVEIRGVKRCTTIAITYDFGVTAGELHRTNKIVRRT
uniref:Uncharacterized protein n=1 Tax=Tanacetum cinerariifolium TaxID=118510 RepID=A0A699HH71_TANCI|nr:hypothetical protein [Tanacetum cinerariifolium]